MSIDPLMAPQPDASGQVRIQSVTGVRRFMRNKKGIIALFILIVMVIATTVSTIVTSGSASAIDFSAIFAPPFTGGHVLGTDDLGRDLLARTLNGGTVSLAAAALATAVAFAIGVPAGLIAGYFGRYIDYWIMRVNDAVMTFPALVLAVAIVGFMGTGLAVVMIAIGVVNIPRVMRVVRALTLSIKEERFVTASRAMGVRAPRIMVRHIMPNLLPTLLVQVSLTFGFAMIAESSLSFLGLGIQPPSESWGSLLSRSMQYSLRAPMYSIGPAVCLILTVLAANILGDAIRESIGSEESR